MLSKYNRHTNRHYIIYLETKTLLTLDVINFNYGDDGIRKHVQV